MNNMGSYNLSRQRGSVPLQKPKKSGFYGDEEDLDPMLFNNSSMFRPDKEMGSPTPSQLSTNFGSNPYGSVAGTGSFGLQQRGGTSNPSFQQTITPTSIGLGGFPLSLQTQQQQSRPQAVSPNRNMFNIGSASSQHSLLTSQANLNQMKRANALPGGLPVLSNPGNTLMNIGQFSRLNDSSQPNFDSWQDFPTLGNRNTPQSQLLTASRNYVGMVSKPSQEPTPEFQIQQEDFPALPGAQNPPTTSSSNDITSKPPTSMGSYDQVVKDSSNKIGLGDKTVGGQQRRGIQTHPDGTVSNIPVGMVADQFGMVGLLTFIRAAETDQNLVALAPGIDLTTLGLNLNSPDNLYSTFQSPWADAPCRPQDIDYHVPSEYLTNVYIREKLAPIKLNRYQEDLLFYLFYVNGGDVLQLAAAAELYNRDWRYHKEERVWITRAPGMEPLAKTSAFERGTYFFFDVHNWRKVAKEFHLEYSKLEERPQLPDVMSYKAT